MEIYLLAPNYCWHTKDLIALSFYSEDFDYIFIADTAPFLSRKVFKKCFSKVNLSYEFVQRIWRIIFCIPWAIYIRIRLSNSKFVHCHGLFALFLSHIALIPRPRVIFTPQGSDILVLPDKYSFIRKFLSNKLINLKFITADSNILLKKVVEICPLIKSHQLKLIQNGIPLDEIRKLNFKKSTNLERKIDLCWIRGFGSIYQFNYFLKLLDFISKISKSELNIVIISAYGTLSIPKEIYKLPNLNITLMPRLNKVEFLKCLSESKVVISIPLSDSSPRSVYESIALGCKLFVTNLNCFDWLPKNLKSEFIFSTSIIKEDSKNILKAVSDFKDIKDLNSLNIKYPNFFSSLEYSNIAKSYAKIFKK